METYAAVELIESHKTKTEFERDYKLYVELLRQLAKEAGLPTSLDSGSTGIISHKYCTDNQPDNASDHVDPYPYLAKWGISKAQFAKDLKNGFSATPAKKAAAKPKQQTEEEDDMKVAIKFVQDIDGFKKGDIYIADYAAGTFWHVPDSVSWRTFQRHYKLTHGGKAVPVEEAKKGFEVHRELQRMLKLVK